MKWMKGEKQGIVVAGGHGKGNNLSQLSNSNGIIVDQSGTLYVADYSNHRIMRWSLGVTERNVIIGGNDQESQLNQFLCPIGLSFDQVNNLYVCYYLYNLLQIFKAMSKSNI
ncbi:unnamed protein product [Rotaria sp. Silwood2]|nr:unnamed protein product [Rotaria sp. Silwood2]